MNEAIWWEEKQAYGYKKCPKWLYEAYYNAVLGTCQDCFCRFDKLTPHRIIRGNKGGLYTVASLRSKENNVKMNCNKCHKKKHSGEPGCQRR